MARFIPFSEEQIERANQVDLVDFLQSQGEKLEKSGREWRWTRHDSVTIHGNAWYRHSEQRGGNAIDFVKEFYNLSFPEAVTTLLEGRHSIVLQPFEQKQDRPVKPFALPDANANSRRVYAYLTKQRGIDPSIITHFVRARTLYEDAAHHNAVFVGLDENGKPRHAHKRSTFTLGKTYCGNVEGSDARYGFSHLGSSNRLYAFEAPIDMMAFISLHQKNWQQHSYIAQNGVSGKAVEHMLQAHHHLTWPVLCLDNDEAGIAAIKRNTQKLKEIGYEASYLLSHCKDWGEQLQVEKGIVHPEQKQALTMELGP